MSATSGVVTVCIPAYRAEAFIDRTLRCARGQTHDAQVIAVSIDRSDDATEEICRAHARDDDRIRVTTHAEQLGWVGNVNVLLDAVDTEYAFVYFHDDLIEPTYTERLVAALADRPDAASAHCDVVLEEGPDHEVLRPGRSYEGTATERLLTYFVSRERGALLRSMVRRTGPADRLRMPVAAVVYEMELVAAGPALHVAEPLYRRWNRRPGGLTHGLARMGIEDLVRGARWNAERARVAIDALDPTPDERDLLEFGLAVYLTRQLRRLETESGASRLVPLRDLGLADEIRLPAAVEALPEDLRALCTDALDRVTRRTASRARLLEER